MTRYETECTGPQCRNRRTGRGKRLFADRRTARKAAKEVPGARMTPYPCPHVNGQWHLGHLPADVRGGTTDKAAYVARVSARRNPA